MNRLYIQFITRTALLLAMALVFQIWFSSFAQPVVGPMINMVLIASVLLAGVWSGIIIGCLTPLVAFMLGIMGFAPMVPFIMLGNTALVVVFALLSGRGNRWMEWFALSVAAFAKFAVLAMSVRYVVTLFADMVPPPVVAAMTLPQLTTALIGGAVAIVAVKLIPQSIKATRDIG